MDTDFERFTTRKQHESFCKHLISSKHLHLPYLLFIAQFHEELAKRPIKNFDWNNYKNGFKAVFEEGEVQDKTFSYHTCLDGWMVKVKGKRPNVDRFKKKDVVKAFRNEVMDQMRDVRFESGLGGKGREWHVGHDWENGDAHAHILRDFVQVYSVDWKAVEVGLKAQRMHHDYKSAYLVDKDLAIKWRAYHRQRAAGMRMERAEHNRL